MMTRPSLLARPTAGWLRGAVAVNLALLTWAVLGPVLTIYPGFGAYTEWVGLFDTAATAPRTLSIAGSIVELWRHVSPGLALLLGVFSWVFPVAKLVACWLAIGDLERGRRPGALLGYVHAFGLLSMTEVVVLAVFALSLKQLPGGTEVEVGYAVWVFVVSTTASLALTRRLSLVGGATSDRQGEGM